MDKSIRNPNGYWMLCPANNEKYHIEDYKKDKIKNDPSPSFFIAWAMLITFSFLSVSVS